MFKKRYLGYFLIAGGTIIGMIVTLLFFITRGERLLLSIVLIAGLAAVALGSVILFTKILDRNVQKVIDEFDADIGEEIEDFLAGRRTNVQTMFIITTLMALAVIFLILKLHKIEATWGGISVVVWALAVSGIVAFVFIKTRWFQDQRLATPFGAFLIPAIAIVLSLLLGLQTEDLRNFGFNMQEQVAFNTYTPSSFNLFDLGDASGFSFNCSDDGCVVLMLIVALIVIALILVAGSACIPQFWVVSVLVLLTIMMVITIHEIRTRRTIKTILAAVESGAAPGVNVVAKRPVFRAKGPGVKVVDPREKNL